MQHRTILAAALVVVASSVLAACTANQHDGAQPDTPPIIATPYVVAAGGANPPTQPDPANPSIAPDATLGTSSSESSSAADPSLLASVYSLLDVGTAQETIDFLSRGSVPETEVAQCMSDAGFEYLPGPGPDGDVAANPALTMSSAEFAASYGFGFAAESLGLLDRTVDDPNLASVQSLTKGQQEAYRNAHNTCAAKPGAVDDSSALNAAIGPFKDSVAADDRIVSALRTWSSCLAAAGFDFDSPQAMRDFYAVRIATSTPDHDQLESWLTEEIAVATVNAPCEAAYNATYRDVILDRFTDFQALFDAARTDPGPPPTAVG